MVYGCKDREKAARKTDEIRKSTDGFGIRQSICRFSCFGWLPSACHAEREYGYFLFSHRLIKGSEMEYIFSFKNNFPLALGGLVPSGREKG